MYKSLNISLTQKLTGILLYFFLFVDQIFGQIFDQIFGQVFGQVFGPEYSVQYYRDGEIQCTVLLGRKNLLHRLISNKSLNFFYPLRELLSYFLFICLFQNLNVGLSHLEKPAR